MASLVGADGPDYDALIYWTDQHDRPEVHSAARLLEDIHRTQDTLLRLSPVTRVGLVARPHPNTLTVLLGALLAERSVVLIDPRSRPDRKRLKAWLSIGLWLDPLSGTFETSLGEDPPLDLEKSSQNRAQPALPEKEAVVVLTSGSSGTARAVRLSVRNLAHNLQGVTERLRDLDVSLPGAPLSLVLNIGHSYGLSVALLALRNRMPLVLHPFPQLVTTVADQMRATRVAVFPSVPSYLGLERELGHPLGRRTTPSLRARLFAGEGLTVGDALAVTDALAGGIVVNMYGLTEHTARVAMGALDSRFEQGWVGYPLDGVELKTSPATDSSEAGEVLVRSDSVSIGYIGSPMSIDADGFLHTGDLGILRDDQSLVLRGRVNEHFLYAGLSIWAGDVEADLCLVPGVADCRVTQPEEGSPLDCEIVLSESEDKSETLERVRRSVRPRRLLGRIEVVDKIDRTASGKKRRR